MRKSTKAYARRRATFRFTLVTFRIISTAAPTDPHRMIVMPVIGAIRIEGDGNRAGRRARRAVRLLTDHVHVDRRSGTRVVGDVHVQSGRRSQNPRQIDSKEVGRDPFPYS